MRSVTIGRAAEITGMTQRAIRFYEQKGLITPERRGRRRLYSPEHIERLARIDRLTGYGFTLAEIRAGIDRRALVKRYGDLRMEIVKKQHTARAIEQELGDMEDASYG